MRSFYLVFCCDITKPSTQRRGITESQFSSFLDCSAVSYVYAGGIRRRVIRLCVCESTFSPLYLLNELMKLITITYDDIKKLNGSKVGKT